MEARALVIVIKMVEGTNMASENFAYIRLPLNSLEKQAANEN